MIHERFQERFLGWLDLIEDHHRVSGSSATGRITSDSPRAGFVGDPDAGLFCHPTIVDGVTAEDALYATETFGPIIGVAEFEDMDEALALANGHGYGLSAAIYTNDPKSAFRFRSGVSAGMLSVNNSTSGAEAHLPFGGNGRVGERQPPVGRVGARPVHPLAGDELGLRGQAPEGADGRARDQRRSGLPAGLVVVRLGKRPALWLLCNRKSGRSARAAHRLVTNGGGEGGSRSEAA